MSESGTVSKSAKKNKKRNKNKADVGGAYEQKHGPDLQDVLTKLKEQLEVAKSTKDHKSANKLRDQIWVLTDVIRGVKTDLPENELDEILSSLPLPSQQAPAEATPPPPASSAASSSGITTTDRRIRTLEKKLKQIEDLKQKQASGVTLEKNQLDKIKSEESIREEIHEITEAMNSVL